MRNDRPGPVAARGMVAIPGLLGKGPLGRTLFLVAGSLAFFFLNLAAIYYFVQQNNPVTVIKEPLVARSAIHEHASATSFSSSSQCVIKDSLAISALARIKTDQCRAKVTDAACRLQNGDFHPPFPSKSACENYDDALAGRHVGCFVDLVKQRLLDGFDYKFEKDNSGEKCAAHCFRAGFLYYGVEFGVECFCSHAVRENATRLEQTRCQEYPCPGDNSTFCGGFNAIDVFRTGLRLHSQPPKSKYIELPMEKKEEGGEVAGKIDEEPSIRIMFLLQLNGRNIRQVRRMLKAIYSPRHYYYVHVDQRQTFMLKEMRSIAALLPNMYVSPDGHATIWGGASLLEMVQGAIRRSLTLPGFSGWETLINMSESDFPILTLRELEVQLASNKGRSYLSSHGYNTGRFLQKQGFDWVFLECDNHMWRIGKRGEFPRNLRIDGGSDWIVLDRQFAEFSVSDHELPLRLRQLYASIILPVESFFHTLAINSEYCERIVGGNLRLTNWNRKQGCRCAALKKVVDWCGCSPLVFTNETASKFELQKAKDRAVYIARKFESLIDIAPVAAAEKQAMRDRPHLISGRGEEEDGIHVNYWRADVDGEAHHLSALARVLVEQSDWSSREKGEFVQLIAVEVYKGSATRGQLRTVWTVEMVLDGSLHHAELLVERRQRVEMRESKWRETSGFQLAGVRAGENIDHKEELFRNYPGYLDKSSSPLTLLEWRALPGTEIKNGKTSPSIRLWWRDPTGSIVARQSLKPYDSMWGSQFAALELSTLNLTESQSHGEWSVDVIPEKGDDVMATVHLPIFDVERFDEMQELAAKYYKVHSTCAADCSAVVWSTFHPDPKSHISRGWDARIQYLV